MRIASRQKQFLFSFGLVLAGVLAACGGQPIEDSETLPSVPATAMPVVVSMSPAGPANDNAPYVFGTTEGSATIAIFTDSGCTSQLATDVADAGGNFAVALTVLDNTVMTFYAQANNGLGASACSTTFANYTEDSAGTTPTLSGTTPASGTNNNAPVVTGTAEANNPVSLYSDAGCSITIASGTADGAGNFTLTLAVANDSTTSIYADATDLLGNVSACTAAPLTYVEDSTGPAPPTFVGAIPAGPANNNAPKITGTTEAGATVYFYSTAACAGVWTSGVANGAGAFTISVNVANNSTNTVYAKARDLALNLGACTAAPATYVEDSVASPPTLVDTTPASGGNNNNPVINGTTEPGAAVVLHKNAACTNILASGTADGAGNFAIPAAVWDNTTTTIYGKITDVAGNTSTCSAGSITYIEVSP